MGVYCLEGAVHLSFVLKSKLVHYWLQLIHSCVFIELNVDGDEEVCETFLLKYEWSMVDPYESGLFIV